MMESSIGGNQCITYYNNQGDKQMAVRLKHSESITVGVIPL